MRAKAVRRAGLITTLGVAALALASTPGLAQTDTQGQAAPQAPAPAPAPVLSDAPMPAKKAQDSHAGYYYPTPGTVEEYTARSRPLAANDRKARLDFVNQFNLSLLAKPYPPQFVLFAKGDNAEKAILVALNGDFANTVYRMRALLALLTTLSRQNDLIKEYKVDDLFTFFDQLRLLGFEQLTVSDGKDFAHQVKFK